MNMLCLFASVPSLPSSGQFADYPRGEMLVGSCRVERKQGQSLLHFSPFADCLMDCLGISFKVACFFMRESCVGKFCRCGCLFV